MWNEKKKFYSVRRILFVIEISDVIKIFSFICLFFYVLDVILDIDILINE